MVNNVRVSAAYHFINGALREEVRGIEGSSSGMVMGKSRGVAHLASSCGV